MFVSLFNFQGPLPLKRRAFCILPHLRRFVNTFFAACPFFLLAAFSALFCFCEAALFQELVALSRERLIILSNHLPFVNSFFSFFLPFFTPYRAFSDQTTGWTGDLTRPCKGPMLVTQCQVDIKGCATEDYSGVLGAAEYIETNPLTPVVSFMQPMCDFITVL